MSIERDNKVRIKNHQETEKMKELKYLFELSEEEVKILAYGGMPKELKLKLQEIAYYIDTKKKIEKKVSKDKPIEKSKKEFKCLQCGRPINHKGNCLPCNVKIKNIKESKNEQ